MDKPTLNRALMRISHFSNKAWDDLQPIDAAARVVAEEIAYLHVGIVDCLKDSPIDREKLIALLYHDQV